MKRKRFERLLGITLSLLLAVSSAVPVSVPAAENIYINEVADSDSPEEIEEEADNKESETEGTQEIQDVVETDPDQMESPIDVTEGSDEMFTDEPPVEPPKTVITDEANQDTDILYSDLETGDIAIDNAHFPDAVFMEYVKRFDLDQDGVLTEAERDQVTEIDCSRSSTNYNTDDIIRDFKGIRYFRNLKVFKCTRNQITSLDVSGLENLEMLHVDGMKSLTDLKINGCAALKEVIANYCKLSGMDLTAVPKLETLDVYANETITCLDVSQNLNLQKLACTGTGITVLDVSRNTELRSLGCSYTNLSELDVSNNKKLTSLTCGSVPLTTLDVSQNPDLQHLECDKTQLKELDVSHNPKLTYLEVSENELTQLDISGCKDLEELSCSDNKLKELNLNENIKLKKIYCNYNELTEINIKNPSILQALTVEHNQIHELCLENANVLEYVFCNNNPLTKITITYNYKMPGLDLPESVEEVDLRYCKVLQELIHDNGNLKTLNIDGCTALKKVSCMNNQLNSAVITECDSLLTLDVSDNELKKLDISHDSHIRSLACQNNQLELLDVNYWNYPNLENLECNNNYLSWVNLDDREVTYSTEGGLKQKDRKFTCSVNSEGVYQVDLSVFRNNRTFNEDWISLSRGTLDRNTMILTLDQDDDLLQPIHYSYDTHNKWTGEQNLTFDIYINKESTNLLESTSGCLVIDGSQLDQETPLVIQPEPVHGHEYNGSHALRYILQVYTKAPNGEYVLSTAQYDSESLGKTWDIVQRDETSLTQVMDPGNIDWHDNRVLECRLGKQQKALIYPVVWDESKNGYTWFPGSKYNENDQAIIRKYMDSAVQDTSQYSFTYKISLKNAQGEKDESSSLITEAACDTADIKLQNHVIISKSRIKSGQPTQTVTLKTKTVPADHPEIMKIHFKGLETIADENWKDFANVFGLIIKADGNGLNGGRLAYDDRLYFTVKVYDKDGQFTGTTLLDGASSFQNEHQVYYYGAEYSKYLPVTEEVFKTLKAGGYLGIESLYPVYSFTCGIEQMQKSKCYIQSVTDNLQGIPLEKDQELGYMCKTHFSSETKDNKCGDLTVEMQSSDVMDAIGYRENGLPNCGIQFIVQKEDQAGNTSENSNMYLQVRISLPEQRIAGMSWNLRNVNFVLQTYQKDESGIYRVIDENTDAHQQPYYKCAGDVEWGGSLLLRYKVLGTQMKNESGDPVVFAIVPYLRGTNTAIQQDLTKISACEFSAQISGTVLGTGSESSRGYEDYTVNGFQMTTAEDPLDDTAQWSELNGTGPYAFSTPVLTVSTENEKFPQVQTVKILATSWGTHAADNNNIEELISGDITNGVIIRNQAKGYEADTQSTDGMPDVKVTIYAPEDGLNTGSPSGWGQGDMQFPFRAYLYNYKDETYQKLDLSDYYSFDDSDNPISGPAKTGWGVAAGGNSYFHTHLADNQAIVIVPLTNKYSFHYEVSLANQKLYSIQEVGTNRGLFRQVQENLYTSGTIGTYGTKSNGIISGQEVVLQTVKNSETDRVFSYLSDSLRENQKMVQLPVTLFDYDFPGLTKTDFSGQSAVYKFLLDPLNNYDYRLNHIGDNKTQRYAGIVESTLTDGIPVFRYGVPFNIFDSNSAASGGGTKTVTPADFEFVYDESTHTYSYNSHLHHAQLESDGVIHQYDHGLGLRGWKGKAAGFFPFNSCQEAIEQNLGYWGNAGKENYNSYLLPEEELDYHFGMKMTQKFVVPENGVITLQNGAGQETSSDMVFKISGDDDIWMFIDGHLVLDIGGIHEAITGEINLTQGTYTVNGATRSLSDILPEFRLQESEEGKADFFGGETGAWAWGTAHEFELFYLERGGTISNMDVSFNLPVFHEFTVGKTVENNDTSQEFDFDLQVYSNKDRKYIGKVYTADGKTNWTEIKSQEGQYSFKLKNGETRTFRVPADCKYTVTETGVQGFVTSWKSDHATGTSLATDLLSVEDSVQFTNTWTSENTPTPTPETTITPVPSETPAPSQTPSISPEPQISGTPVPSETTPVPTKKPSKPSNPSITPSTVPGGGGNNGNGGGYGGSTSYSGGSSPKTGDTVPVGFWLGLLAVSLAAIFTSFFYKNKKIRKQENNKE